MRDLNDCRLYGILDLGYVEAGECCGLAAKMVQGGVDIIQLRGKNVALDRLTTLAQEIHAVTAPAEIPLVVNDHPEIAARVPVEGVHVGQDDGGIASVRELVGRDLIVGKSTHSLTQADAAVKEGADYIGFGPVFATPTKPDYHPIGLKDIARVHQDAEVPIFCIGGIKRENLVDVIAAGARRVVIVSGLLAASDIVKYAYECKQLLLAAESSRLGSAALA